MYNSRAIATLALAEVLLNKQSLKQILPKFKGYSAKPEDAAFIQALCFGVLRSYPKLKFITSKLLEHPLKAKDEDILILICVGIYQLLELNTAAHAALSETVEAASQLKKPWAKNLVNAVLRNYLRKAPLLLESLEREKNEEVIFQHPNFLIEKIKTAWPENWENILFENNKQSPMILRVNVQKIQPNEYLKLLKDKNIKAQPLPNIETGIILESPCDINALPGFSQGLVSVQDGAAQLAATLLDSKKGMRLLDACAAPGGKTAHILEKTPDLAQVIALDISEDRLKGIVENLERLELQHLNVQTIVGDATQPNTWWDGQLFDRILLDAPCSATGVIRRHPDIKYLREASDFKKYANQQISLLKALWPLLKQDGSLLYATCSILPEENAALIQRFLKEEPSACLLPMTLPWKEVGVITDYGWQLFPGQNNVDGFFYCRLGRKP